MRDKIFKITISKYVSYLKNFLLDKVENVTFMNEVVFHKMLDYNENHTMYIFLNEYLATTSFFV